MKMLNLIEDKEAMTKAELKRAILELNNYLIAAIDLNDKSSIEDIRQEMSQIINMILNYESM